MRVMMHTSTAENCGVADYSRDLVAALRGFLDIQVVPVEPASRNPLRVWAVGARLSAGNLAHIQHNYGFWGRGSLTYMLALKTLRRRLRVPVVMTAHSVRPLIRRSSTATLRRQAAFALGLDDFIDRGTFQIASRVIVHSHHQRHLLLQRGFPPQRLIRIPPGVPAAAPASPGRIASFRAAWDLDGKRVLGLFGFIQPNKGCETLVRALAHLPNDVVLIVLGDVRTDGEAWYGERLQALIHDLALDRRVRVTGFLSRPQLSPAFGAVDLCVLPYATDSNVSYSARLCLAHGRPLLAKAVGGFRELQDEHRCVELFESDAPLALAQRIAELLEHESRLAELAAAAQAYGAAWTWRDAGADTVAVYREVMDQG